jgi:predicted DNA-binding protein
MALSVKLPARLAAELDALARESGSTKSDLMREALEKLVSERRNRPPSFYDLAKDACGIIKDGPEDLSTNPKHMEGFGE